MLETDVKELIVDSANKFFSRYGFHKTTMDEIAKNIHKAKGVLYYYYKSKEELFNEVLKKELNQVKTELNKIAEADKDYLTKIKDYFLARLRLLNTAVNYHETLKADFFEKYNFVKDVRDDFIEFEKTKLTQIFSKGNTEGDLDIKDVKLTVNMVMMMITSMEFPLYLQNKYEEYESTIAELITIITNSLRSYKK